ncbi:MAG: transposase [Kiritimatiellales bacterium]|nr:transposase [Kiritimatiellales bacterium]
MTQRHPTQNEDIMLVTTNTFNGEPYFAKNAYAHEAVEHIYRTQQRMPFFLYGFVIMPDHCHFVLRVPESGSISKIMRTYKMGLNFQIGISPLWQPRFHNRIVDDIGGAIQYVHNNPVKAELCDAANEYQWSSACGKWDVTEFDGW